MGVGRKESRRESVEPAAAVARGGATAYMPRKRAGGRGKEKKGEENGER